MTRGAAIFVLVIACSSCMEMRETVERMVMVRTTGSDLQPAATGYIYKKESDGPASVVKMGETEVMEHLSKLYEKPEAYKAPLPAPKGPFHEKDDDKAASDASEVVIPVVESEESDYHIPGTAEDEYEKIFKHYADVGDDYKDFADYLHGLGHYGHGIFEHGAGSDYGLKGHNAYGDKGYKGYATNHKYGKGGAGDYHTEKYTSYSIKNGGGHEKHHDEVDSFGGDHEKGHGYKSGDHGHKASHTKGQEIDGYHKVFDKDEFKKDHDFYDGEKGEGSHHKYADGHEHHGADQGGFEKGGSHESGHHDEGYGKGVYVHENSGDEADAAHSAEQGGESSHHRQGNFGIKEGSHHGKGYSFGIKH